MDTKPVILSLTIIDNITSKLTLMLHDSSLYKFNRRIGCKGCHLSRYMRYAVNKVEKELSRTTFVEYSLN